MTRCQYPYCGGRLWEYPNEHKSADDQRKTIGLCILCGRGDTPTRAPTAADHDRYRARPSTIDAGKLAGRLEERHRKVGAL